MPAEKVLADIGPQITAMDTLITQCEQRYGSRIKILDHPILGPLTRDANGGSFTGPTGVIT